jgi:3-deoxy-D-manno-octulosonate 8-phosphate phosphatase (KDO 8-P phosphatase)
MEIRDHRVIKEKIDRFKLLLVNCEGVITDSSLMITENGEELRRLSAKDVFGFNLIIERAGIEIVLFSAEEVIAFKRLAARVNLTERYLGNVSKDQLMVQVCKDYNVKPEEIAYIGCELDDLPLMQAAGLSICPLDAAYEVINKADYVCNSCGGSGVIREFADLIESRKASVASG